MADVLGSIREIDSCITQYQHTLSVSPRSEPIRPVYILRLVIAQLERYELSKQREDLDKSIFRLTESIFLPPRSWLEHGQMIHEAFLFLALTLFKRSVVSKQPEDAIYAAKYLRHLRDQPHQMVKFPRHAITTSLVDALAFQVELKAGNVMQNIGEMAVLCHELLTLEMSDVGTTCSVTLFARAVLSTGGPQNFDQPLDQIIECLRLAREHRPDLPEARRALIGSLICRYSMTFGDDDYEEAASILDETIARSSPGDGQDEFVALSRRLVTGLAKIRSLAYETPEYLEAIYRIRALLGSSPVEEPIHSSLLFDLEGTAKQRSRYFGSIEGLNASSGGGISQLREALPVGYGDNDPELGRTVNELDLLIGLLSGIHDGDIAITKIDEAIEKSRSIVASNQSGPLPVFLFGIFGDILLQGFERTHKVAYLDEAITTLRQGLEHPLLATQLARTSVLSRLSVSLLTRSCYIPGRRTQDLDEALELFSQCANDEQASFPDRLQLACSRAHVARLTRHPSVSTAYESAVSLMQDTLIFAPTLQLQHATLATFGGFNSMPLDYASYQIDLHQLEEAIETLERGRALLWSEMRHLRTSLDQLPEVDPDIGHKFAAVNRELEELTKSVPPSHKLSMDDGATDELRAVDPFGRLLLKQRSLLKERERLISQIQALQGFNASGFLTSSSFDTLRAAAHRGPVIIVNHSEWRSDILVLVRNTPPSLITTPRDFYHRASALKDKLLDSRHKYGLSSSHYDEILASVLAELYNLVGKPVIDRLRELSVPEQSRIWWCPTSVFCSLPLHAMGPVPSDDDEKRYFLDLYICSYTPTLSALIQSRNRDSSSRSSGQPSLLLVAQPDPSLPTVGGEIQVVQGLKTDVTSLISEAATPAAVVDGFHHHRFVHFVCHGTLEAGKPFEAGFELYGDERLTLLEIVRSHLPTAEFAFLSACHTAEVTEGSITDEGLHLAAAVQYSGFRSVVGTMWAMVDEDGPDLAAQFYKVLFSTSRREQGIPYHERSAKALRFAVQKLRRKRRISLERWVNFVHYGA